MQPLPSDVLDSPPLTPAPPAPSMPPEGFRRSRRLAAEGSGGGSYLSSVASDLAPGLADMVTNWGQHSIGAATPGALLRPEATCQHEVALNDEVVSVGGSVRLGYVCRLSMVWWLASLLEGPSPPATFPEFASVLPLRRTPLVRAPRAVRASTSRPACATERPALDCEIPSSVGRARARTRTRRRVGQPRPARPARLAARIRSPRTASVRAASTSAAISSIL